MKTEPVSIARFTNTININGANTTQAMTKDKVKVGVSVENQLVVVQVASNPPKEILVPFSNVTALERVPEPAPMQAAAPTPPAPPSPPTQPQAIAKK